MPRLWLAALGAAALLGCGDDSSGGGPNQFFPDVAGTYVVSGTFDGISEANASFTGTVTVEQESLESSLLTGTGTIQLTDSTRNLTVTGDLEDASVTLAGIVVFTISGAAGATWEFSGERGGDVLEGDHTLTDGTGSHSGPWSGER